MESNSLRAELIREYLDDKEQQERELNELRQRDWQERRYRIEEKLLNTMARLFPGQAYTCLPLEDAVTVHVGDIVLLAKLDDRDSRHERVILRAMVGTCPGCGGAAKIIDWPITSRHELGAILEREAREPTKVHYCERCECHAPEERPETPEDTHERLLANLRDALRELLAEDS